MKQPLSGRAGPLHESSRSRSPVAYEEITQYYSQDSGNLVVCYIITLEDLTQSVPRSRYYLAIEQYLREDIWIDLCHGETG